MTTGTHAYRSRQFFAGKAHSQPPWQNAPTASPRTPKLMGKVLEGFPSRHYSQRKEQTYCQWVKRFICFHSVRCPLEMGAQEINAFHEGGLFQGR